MYYFINVEERHDGVAVRLVVVVPTPAVPVPSVRRAVLRVLVSIILTFSLL